MTESRTAERYPHVFQPIRIGAVEVRNRIFMSPHGIPLETANAEHATHHQPAAEHAYYFAERAAGGVGLILQADMPRSVIEELFKPLNSLRPAALA